MKYRLSSAFIFFLLYACSSSVTSFEIDPGDFDRSQLPIIITTNKSLNPEESYYFRNTANGNSFPVQVLSENNLIGMFNELTAGSMQTYELIQGGVAENQLPEVSLSEESEGIQILVKGKPVLFYQTATAFPQEGLPDYYKRSGFIHPLQSPNGNVLTDDFPVGHTHQHALFNAWTNTTYKGNKIDFWNQQDQSGTVEHEAVEYKKSGSLAVQLKTKLNHLSIADGVVLEEEWLITVYPVADYFLFDLYSNQTNTSSDTLFINDYHYGGMALRGSKEWNRDDSLHFTNSWKILTSEGLTLEEANHTQAKWVDASGIVNGSASGVTVFGFPDNFRYPQSIRVHPEMPYWVYSPMVEGAFFIAPGQNYKSRFRYYVHDGMPDNIMLEKIQNDLENPINIKEL